MSRGLVVWVWVWVRVGFRSLDRAGLGLRPDGFEGPTEYAWGLFGGRGHLGWSWAGGFGVPIPPSPPTTLRYPCGVGVLMCPGPPRDAGAGPAAGGPSVGPATPDPLAPHGTGPRPGPLPVCPARGLPHRWSAHPLPGRISANCRPLSAVPREPAGSWPWHPTANVRAPCTSLVRHGCSLVSRQTGPYRSIEGDHVQEALLHRFSGAAQSLPIPACSMRAVANVRLHR